MTVTTSFAIISHDPRFRLRFESASCSRAISGVDAANSINYATSASYAPQGALSSVTNGASLVSTFYYNSRLQPCRLSSKSSGTAPISCTDAANVGNILDLQYDFALGTANNGNVAKITNKRDTNRSVNFAYDPLNRIYAAFTDGNLWGETFQIDAWGNLNKILAYSGKPQPETLNQLAGANNRFTGMSYDAAGNLLNDGLTNYTFNAESQIANINAGSVTYFYDGDGKRVKKSSGKLYWYGAGSDPIAESDLSGNLSAEYIFFNGKRIARLDLPSAAVHYYFSDHLGSASVVTSSTGTIQDESDYYPFGGERTVTNSDPSPYKFTGKERDTESGLDHFGARYYSSALGRFATPDPIEHPSQSSWDEVTFLATPQRWNQYAYVLNNPLNHTDPTGNEIPVYETETGARDSNKKPNPAAWKFMVGAELTIGTAGVASEAGVFARALAYGRGLIGAAIGYFLTPQGQQTAANIAQAAGDYFTGTTSPFTAAEVGAAREAAVAASVGGKLSGMKVFGASTSTDVDVIGKAGEYIGVGGGAKGLKLSEFGQKLSALKEAAQNAGAIAKYYLEEGTSQQAIDLAKKILGAGNVVVFRIVKRATQH